MEAVAEAGRVVRLVPFQLIGPSRGSAKPSPMPVTLFVHSAQQVGTVLDPAEAIEKLPLVGRETPRTGRGQFCQDSLGLPAIDRV